MEKKQAKTLREELEEVFSKEYILGVGSLIRELAKKFYESNRLEGQVYFDDRIFMDCLIDILVDLARLKDFHDISRLNYVKLMAYSASWCLKRKPFQIMEGAGEEFLYINEKFALNLLLQAGGCYDRKTKYSAKAKNELIQKVAQIQYHLRYRNTNPQTLELFLVGLESGKKLHIAD